MVCLLALGCPRECRTRNRSLRARSRQKRCLRRAVHGTTLQHSICSPVGTVVGLIGVVDGSRLVHTLNACCAFESQRLDRGQSFADKRSIANRSCVVPWDATGMAGHSGHDRPWTNVGRAEGICRRRDSGRRRLRERMSGDLTVCACRRQQGALADQGPRGDALRRDRRRAIGTGCSARDGVADWSAVRELSKRRSLVRRCVQRALNATADDSCKVRHVCLRRVVVEWPDLADRRRAGR
jgi:hypothetical protein